MDKASSAVEIPELYKIPSEDGQGIMLRMGEPSSAQRILACKPFGKPKAKQNNINMDLRVVGTEDGRQMQLA